MDIFYYVYAIDRVALEDRMSNGRRRNMAIEVHYQHGGGYRHWIDGMLFVTYSFLISQILSPVKSVPCVTSRR
jgi:hypothetical protein